MKVVALLLCAASASLAAGLKVRVRSSIVEMPLEQYVTAALAGESSVFRSTEALKAMAVASRTYAVRLRGRHQAEGFDFCDTTHCQRIDPGAVTSRLEAAASQTAGELLWFEAKPAFTPYTADCGGVTEDAAAVWPDLAAPYLHSVADRYCPRDASPWQWSVALSELAAALERSGLRVPRGMTRITILNLTESGRARTLLLTSNTESVRLSASSLRFAAGRELGWNTVRSGRYRLYSGDGRVSFRGTGAGHGVGLCQRGAEGMGRAGQNYREILAQYYPGTTLGVTGRGLSWQRLGGESLTLLTTQPDRDRIALGPALRAARELEQRTGWALPSGIEVRAYPDLDSFRNSTAEPGWVAARTDGRVIHLQPVNVLQSRKLLEGTLKHELMHVLLNEHSKAGLPVWFQEGLVEYLLGTRGTGAATVQDVDLRQRANAAQARRAYADAAARVRALVDRYGETAVLSWLKRGLPPDVTKAAASQPATKKQ